MEKRKTEERRIVFSTVQGRICPECGNPVSDCRCGKAAPALPKSGGAVRVRRETKGRGGKTMTTVSGIPLNGADLEELASKLKRRLGTGGSVKDGVIEIQGDRVDMVIAELVREGYPAKRAGG